MLNRVRRGIAGGQTNVLPVDGEGDHQSSSLDVCSRQRSPQVGICEPVEVDDDYEMFGRQRIDNTEHIFVR